MAVTTDQASNEQTSTPVVRKALPEHLGESLSSLIDNESSELELRRLLKASETDPEIRETWSRYQMVSAAIRGQHAESSFSSIDLSAAIMEAVEAEPAHGKAKGRVWLESLGKVGIAASVASAVVFSAQFIGLQAGGPDSGSAATVAIAEPASETPRNDSQSVLPASSLPAGFHAPALNARVVSAGSPNVTPQSRYVPVATDSLNRSQATTTVPSTDVQEYLQRVMEIHTGHAALNSSRGMLPYARVPASGGEAQ